MLSATVSGSFHRFMSEIEQAVHELSAIGVRVLSPAYPKVVDHIGEFLFVASDRVRSIRMVQDRHLDCIESSDFLWLVCPDGYVGQSASMELGFAVARGVRVFSTCLPGDLTLRQYVRKVDGLQQAVAFARQQESEKSGGFLLDPHASVETAHRVLEKIRGALNQPPRSIDDKVARQIRADRAMIGKLIGGRH